MAHQPKRMIVIGCGGIGSWLSHALAKALNFQAPNSMLILIDGDTFEPKNAERQTFTHPGNKAHVLAHDIQPSHPAVFVLPRAAWIVPQEAANETEENTDEDAIIVEKISAEDLLEDGDIIYLCVDNYAARKLVVDAAKNLPNVDVFSGGNGGVDTGDALEGSIYHYRRRDGQDVTLSPDFFHDEIANPTDRNPGELSCQERAELDGGSQLLAVNMAVAAYMAAKTSQVIFGTEEESTFSLERAEVYIDLKEGLSLPYDRRPEHARAAVEINA